MISVVEKMIKQRKDSIAQFEKAARTDLADKEKFELAILEGYLPQQLSAAEVDAIIAEAVAATGAKSPGRHGQGDGHREAPPRRARRHGQSLGAGEGQARGLSVTPA